MPVFVGDSLVHRQDMTRAIKNMERNILFVFIACRVLTFNPFSFANFAPLRRAAIPLSR
jgi:uncharacterized membrane protein YdjX (TVP38/TMEM64 family)